MSTLKEKMQNNFCIGIFSKTTDSSLIEAAGIAGLNFVVLDMEHGPITFEVLQNHIRAAKLRSIASIVRVKEIDRCAIAAALDIGADGVQIPNISTADQARVAVKAARFYPYGDRGVCRFVRAADYGNISRDGYFKRENEKLLILQVEGKEGAKNIDDILKVPGFDILFIGPYDLSQSIGSLGKVESSEVINLMREIAVKAKDKNIILGSFSDDEKRSQLLKQEGFKYIAYSVDINIFLNGCIRVKKWSHE